MLLFVALDWESHVFLSCSHGSDPQLRTWPLHSESQLSQVAMSFLIMPLHPWGHSVMDGYQKHGFVSLTINSDGAVFAQES